MFVGPLMKNKILRLAKASEIDNDGGMIIYKGILYYVELCLNYIKPVRVARDEDYHTYISLQTSKEV